MTAGETAHAGKGSDHAAEADAPSVRCLPRRRVSVDEILPPTLIEEIQGFVHAAPAVTAKLVKELDDRFDIEDRFGVSRRRLRNYVQTLHDKSAPSPRGGAQPKSSAQRNGSIDNVPVPDESKPVGGARLRAHRLRQASIASILDATFGSLADCSPELWDRRAYLMLVGMVYDRLALAEDELPSEELIALAKVLAEARRAEVRAREHERSNESQDSAPPPTGPLPENFADIVRQVYGTNFHAPSESRSGRIHNGE